MVYCNKMEYEVRKATILDANGCYLEASEKCMGRPYFVKDDGEFVLSYSEGGAHVPASWGIRSMDPRNAVPNGANHCTWFFHASKSMLPPEGEYRCSGASCEVTQRFAPRKRRRLAAGNRAWKQRKFTDAVVVCGSERIPVHRGILCASSCVFDAAFSSPLSEGQNAVYEIQESPPGAVEAMLAFIYTGEHECLVVELATLLELAVQYQLPELTANVASKLLENVSCENVHDHLAVMKRHRHNPEIKQPLEKLIKVIKEDTSNELILALA